MKLVFATHNQGKVAEMRALLAALNLDVITADEAGVTDDVAEDGKTFEENALIKARFVAKKSGEWSVADDSGICIDALGCAPGIFTARWAGPGASAEQIVAHTLEQMKDVPEGKRTAWFESYVALVAPDGREWTFTGKINGHVTSAPEGIAHPKLPYDVIFMPDGLDRTFAEMTGEEKNTMSHRGQAFQQLKEFLRTQL